MTIDEFNATKKKIETMKQEAAKTQGAYEQALNALKQYGASTIEEAEAILLKMRKKEDRLQEELNDLLAEFEKATASVV